MRYYLVRVTGYAVWMVAGGSNRNELTSLNGQLTDTCKRKRSGWQGTRHWLSITPQYHVVRGVQIYINHYASVVIDVTTLHWIFLSKSDLVRPTGHRLCRPPPDPPRPRHCYCTQLPSVSPAKKRVSQSKSASEGSRKVPSRGRLARSPGKEGIPGSPRGRRFHHFQSFSPGIFFVFPFLSSYLYARLFPGDGTLSSPTRIIFNPRFWLSMPTSLV